MDAAPRLKVIATPTTGLNHIDLREAERRGIQRDFSSRRNRIPRPDLRHRRTHARADLRLAAAFARRLPHSRPRAAGTAILFRGRELHGKTAGIIGYGRVGRMVAGYLQALGMTVLAADSDPAALSPIRRSSIVPLARSSRSSRSRQPARFVHRSQRGLFRRTRIRAHEARRLVHQHLARRTRG